ncbi:hypothetical protein SLEP1_g10155 [Rubroshorea leprosula]|uniref:Uncharacterized protein n=1 Tax=Rubroshorea leprosula TaxID=152421 RepID=A0AAV5ICW6_9ROSI|nr:hypothetical protein SLEP1_g10155 [Rubroshorea leprosula]
MVAFSLRTTDFLRQGRGDFLPMYTFVNNRSYISPEPAYFLDMMLSLTG